MNYLNKLYTRMKSHKSKDYKLSGVDAMDRTI